MEQTRLEQAELIFYEIENYNCKFVGQVFNLNKQSISGEVVFNTGMTGYEETITDPSYAGQILVFTYPIIGNYGVSNGDSWESKKIHVKAVICENIFTEPAHYALCETFFNWLKQEGVPLLIGVDTRELTKVLRDYGVLNGIIYQNGSNLSELGGAPLISTDLVSQVSTKHIQNHGNGKYKIILVDCGVKANIIRSLLMFDVTIKQVPHNYDYTGEDYDGILLSNGPGDPKSCTETISILQKVMLDNGEDNIVKPIFGICLGSELMALSAEADTYKLNFGHRGQNQPCIDVATNRCYLTSQNHGYAICDNTLPHDWQITFLNLNDNTIAGIKHKSLPFSSVQFHPEASPGPHDTNYLFTNFMNQVKQLKDGHTK